MPSTRATRLKSIALVCNVSVLVAFAALLASVFVLHEPRGLLTLALPLSWLAMGVQLAAFRAENDEMVCSRCSSKLDVVRPEVERGRRPRSGFRSCPACGARFRVARGTLLLDQG